MITIISKTTRMEFIWLVNTIYCIVTNVKTDITMITDILHDKNKEIRNTLGFLKVGRLIAKPRK